MTRFYYDGNPALGPGGTPITSFFGYQNNLTQVVPAGGASTLSLHSVQLNGGDYARGRSVRAKDALLYSHAAPSP